MWIVAQHNIMLSQLIMWQSSSQNFNLNIDLHPQHLPPRPPPPQATPHQPPMGKLKSCHPQRLALSQMPLQIPLVMVTWPLNPEAPRSSSQIIYSSHTHLQTSSCQPSETNSKRQTTVEHLWLCCHHMPFWHTDSYQDGACVWDSAKVKQKKTKKQKQKKNCYFSQFFCARGWATSLQMWLGRDIGLLSMALVLPIYMYSLVNLKGII